MFKHNLELCRKTTSFVVVASALLALAPVSTVSARNTFPTSGYVGLGTLSPTDPLTLSSPSSGGLILGQWNKGVSVGDMEAILLAKIEELTVHQIEQQERLLATEEKLAAVQTKNRELHHRKAAAGL